MASHGTGLPTTTVLENIKGATINYDPKKTRVIPILILSTVTDNGNTGSTHILRAGQPMSQYRDTDSANYGKWTNTSEADTGDGISICEGILASNVNMKDQAGTAQDTVGFLLVEGTILETDLITDYRAASAGLEVADILNDLGMRLGIIAGATIDSTRGSGLGGTTAPGAAVAVTAETNITVIPGPTVL